MKGTSLRGALLVALVLLAPSSRAWASTMFGSLSNFDRLEVWREGHNSSKRAKRGAIEIQSQ
jgi:hypothetical protein